MKIVFAAGGTGGHIYPALAIADQLRRMPATEVAFIGSAAGMETTIIPQYGYQLHTIALAKSTLPGPLRLIPQGMAAARGVIRARSLLQQLRPQVVVGTGGYVSAPVVLAAAYMGIPTLIHEQNAVLGMANRMLAPIVTKILLTFAESAVPNSSRAKAVHTGLPVRDRILAATRAEALSFWGFSPQMTTIAVLGGSQGAQKINQIFVAAARQLVREHEIQVIHITGPRNYPQTMAEWGDIIAASPSGRRYQVVPYLEQIEYALAAADLAVCRAGASNLAEITVKGIPALIIPYPFAAANHQELNAGVLQAAGAAEILRESDLTAESLVRALSGLIKDRPRREQMAAAAMALARPDAAQRIVELIIEVHRGNPSKTKGGRTNGEA